MKLEATVRNIDAKAVAMIAGTSAIAMGATPVAGALLLVARVHLVAVAVVAITGAILSANSIEVEQ
jgi:hypothetical protein